MEIIFCFCIKVAFSLSLTTLSNIIKIIFIKVSKNEKKQTIIQLHCPELENSQIIKLLKIYKSTVYHAVNRFKELNTPEKRFGSGRPLTACTKKVIKLSG